MNFLNSVSSTMLAKTLDGLWAKQQAIASNIAHSETPGYKAKFVTFEDELRAAIQDGEARTKSEKLEAIRNTKAKFGVSDGLSLRADGNNVDVEKESAELARAQIQFTSVLRAMDDNTARLRAAITGTTR